MKRLTYEDALNFLYNYIDRGGKKPPQQDEARPARTSHLLDLLGNPHQRYPTLHITGTKGKGSVSAMCASILRAAGYRVGMLTSPHLQELRERYQINQAMVSQETLTEAVAEINPTLDRFPEARWPEVITSLGFYLFAREQVDIAVVEVAYGGRLDSTNVITPITSVMTSISYDHMHLLGNTLAEIAWEKSGIIKPGVPVVSAPQKDEARQVIEKIAAQRKSPLTLVGRDLSFQALPPSLNGQSLSVTYPNQPPKTYTTALIGQHQAINTAVVLGVMDRVKQANFAISENAIREGLWNVNWPGRMEIIEQNPIVLLDSAHNGESGRWLRENIEAIFPQRPIVLVYGSKPNKDIDSTLSELIPMADYLVLTRSAYPATVDPDQLIDFARHAGFMGQIEAIADLQTTIEHAKQLAGVAGLVCITGSMFIVGEVRTLYGLRPNEAVRVSNAHPTGLD
ncbi:MAG: bifunctional folylpolyglutamate synthase/dihydrofolate synthase [Chloroflexi bacterium]|nr:bifunctional folylpolyglutamate synthase/dihydrofolate synthase [Chloroflexota bacterium]